MLKNPVTLIKSAVGALRDPLRQDLVAAVGEITSTFPTAAPLHNLRDRMVCNFNVYLIFKVG